MMIIKITMVRLSRACAWAATLAACLWWSARSAQVVVFAAAVMKEAKEEEEGLMIVVWVLVERTKWFSYLWRI